MKIKYFLSGFFGYLSFFFTFLGLTYYLENHRDYSYIKTEAVLNLSDSIVNMELDFRVKKELKDKYKDKKIILNLPNKDRHDICELEKNLCYHKYVKKLITNNDKNVEYLHHTTKEITHK